MLLVGVAMLGRSADEGLDKTALLFWTSRLEVRLGADNPVL